MTWLFLFLGNCIKRSGWSNIFWVGYIKCTPALSDSREAFPHTICSPKRKELGISVVRVSCRCPPVGCNPLGVERPLCLEKIISAPHHHPWLWRLKSYQKTRLCNHIQFPFFFFFLSTSHAPNYVWLLQELFLLTRPACHKCLQS